MMFSTIAVGKKISALRKERNMTQMELADLMGVSYQAVSNWERGNSMPDISKLPELANIFGVTIDELLGSASPLVKSAAEDKMESYLEENKVTVDEVAEAAPILKPVQVDAALDSVQAESMKDLAGVAPFASVEKLSRMVEEMITNAAPRLQTHLRDAAGKVTISIGGKHQTSQDGKTEMNNDAKPENHDLDGIEDLAPFLSEEALAKIARQLLDEGRSFAGIAAHMDEDDVGAYAKIMAERGQDISDILPFMDEDDVSACAELLVSHGLNINHLLPFMDEDDIGRQAVSFAEQGLSANMLGMLPFMDEDDVGKCARIFIEKGIDITPLLPFMDEDDVGELAMKMYETHGVSAIHSWAPFIGSDTLQQIAEDIIEKHGYKAVLPLAPFLK